MSIAQGVSQGSTPKSAISYTYSNDPYNSSALYRVKYVFQVHFQLQVVHSVNICVIVIN